MRKDALVPAKLDSADLDVVDVGGGTGFCTIGIVKEGVKVEEGWEGLVKVERGQEGEEGIMSSGCIRDASG